MINLELSPEIIADSNYWHRRFFRCWLDGSYKGEDHYKRNCAFVRQNHGNARKMRSFVISEFCQFMAQEFDCSASTVQRHAAKKFSKAELAKLNAELIVDAVDLIRDELEAGA